MQLNDRLYTSTEVAEILGVSLRSVYRYLEDGKLDAEIKTATGRLRFTRQNILDFLHPAPGNINSNKEAEVQEVPVKEEASVVVSTTTVEEQVVEATVEEEDVDWLSRFKASAEKFRQEQEQALSSTQTVETSDEPVEADPEVEEIVPEPEPVVSSAENENLSGLVDAAPVENAPAVEEEPEDAPDQTVFYYRSLSGGLKDVAQNVDKVSRRSSVDYAFTLNAGLSLYKPLKDPFSVLHVYIRSQDRDLFEKLLRLVPSDESNAQLCLIFSEDAEVFDTRVELHGLYVVSKDQLRRDIDTFGKQELVEELQTA
jgi:excisionase family DNA binding protein